MITLDGLPPWRATVVDTTGQPGGQVRVAVVDGRRDGDGSTFTVTLGFKACVEAFEMQRFQVIAARLGARLIVVDTPGFGYTGSRLLPAERKALRAGDFTVLAARMLCAVTAVAGHLRDRPIGVLGYSMGSSTGAAIARVAGTMGLTVDTLVLVEPVAGRRWNLLGLASAMLRDDRHVQRYLDETALVTGAVAPFDRRPDDPRPKRSRADLMALATALTRGGLVTDLAAAVGRGLHRIVVVHGDESLLSQRATNDALTAVLHGYGVSTTVLSTAGRHGFWHSLPAVAHLTDQITDALAESP